MADYSQSDTTLPVPPDANVSHVNHRPMSKTCSRTSTQLHHTPSNPSPTKKTPRPCINLLKSKRDLKIAHLNIWSLRRKVDQLRILLNDNPFDIVGLSETYLTAKTDDSELHVDGYTLYRKDRGSRGGGVALYVSNELPHEICTDINNSIDIEALWVKVKRPYSKSVYVCSLYRPPSADHEYFEKMLLMLEHVMEDNNEIIVTGDFNYDYVVDETLANNPAHYIELLLNCKQLIQTPTRITPTSSSTIDLIFSSMPECHGQSGTVKCTMSDHYMIYTIVKCNVARSKKPPRTLKVRDFKSFDPLAFNYDLMECNLLYEVDSHDNIDDAWESWSSMVLSIMNKHAPLKIHRLKDRNNPWITREIVLLMYKRDNIHKKAVRSSNQQLFDEYRKCRNSVVKEIRKAKKDYYTNKVHDSKGSRQMWRTLRPLIRSKSSNHTVPIEPNELNDFFTQIGPELHTKFPNDNELHWTQPTCIHDFNFTSFDEDHVLKDLYAMSPDSNLDLLGFDSRLIRIGADVLVASLTTLFNLSIKCARLPNDLKKARVTPIFKCKGERTDPGNYRPISVIPHIAKILEKCVQSQLMSYLLAHNLITCDQSAFLKGHSTQTSLHKMFDDLLGNINDGYVNGACFFDLAKCFDTIDHSLLIKKLEKYGVRGSALAWFNNYLSERSQCVSVNNAMSDFRDIHTGVPQGSVLGPILFLIFVNDLPSSLTSTMCNLYADDTEIHSCGQTLSEVETILQQDINNIVEWFNLNKLTVNTGKSFAMLFSSNPNINAQGLNLHVNGNAIECVQTGTYIGVHPDSNLKWNHHIAHLCKKISPKVGLLGRLKKILPTQYVELIYKSIVQPHIDYCITVWGNADNKYLDKVQGLQNRAARIITGNYNWYIRGIELVKQLGWQNVRERRDYFTALLVHKAIHNTSPDMIQDLFTLSNEIQSRQTRSSSTNNLYVPRVNKHVFNQSLQVAGARVWNSLPVDLRNITNFNAFKYRLKKHR